MQSEQSAQIKPSKLSLQSEGEIDELTEQYQNVIMGLGKHEFMLKGRKYVCYPTVYSPSLFTESFELIDHFPFPKGGSFLEIGTGCGVIALEAEIHGCAQVVGLDISEDAINNNLENQELLEQQLGRKMQVKFFVSDIFNSIPEGQKFSAIFWNFPCQYTCKSPSEMTMLERAFKDSGYVQLERYLRDHKNYLEEGGAGYILWHPQVANNELFKSIITKLSMQLQEVYTIKSFELEGVLYKLIP